jgi:hypothetical protein
MKGGGKVIFTKALGRTRLEVKDEALRVPHRGFNTPDEGLFGSGNPGYKPA